MNARKPLIYLALFLALGLVYYFYEYKGGEGRKKEDDLAKKALVFQADSVSSFRVLRVDSLGADSLVLTREAGGWRITCPLDAPADSAAVARLLHSAADAPVDRVVEDSAAGLAAFGLDRPGLTLSVQLSGADKPPLGLFLGNKNPTDSYVYAISADKPRRVVLISSWVRTDLDKRAEDLRDRKALHFNSTEIESLSLERGGSTVFSARRADSGGWELTAPLAAPAEGDSLKELLLSLEQAEALSFIDSLPADGAKAFGLEAPALTLSLSGQKGEVERKLFIGNKNPAGDYYARRQGMANFYVLPASLVERLTLDPARLRDRALVRAVRERIDSLAFAQSGGKALVLRKDSAGVWNLRAPETFRADGSRVDGLLWDLKDLRARRFVDQPEPKALAALDNPVLSVTVAVSGGAARLDFARLNPTDSLVFVRVSSVPGLVLVDSAALGKLAPGVEELRYRKIFEFDTGAVDRVRLEYADKKIMLEKKDEAWKMTAPEKAAAQDWKAQNILWDLEGVNFESVASESGADSLTQGFGKPRLRVALLKGDSLVAQAAFGDSLPGGKSTLLRHSGDRRTFRVGKSLLDGLPSKVEDLKAEEKKDGGN